jgi:hypothetical protein
MTLVLGVLGRKHIWLLTDRRLSAKGRVPRDDGCKLALIEMSDGVAIVGYAGLGATRAGIEPSAWINAAFRNKNGTVLQFITALASASAAEFPRHLAQFPSDYPRRQLIAAVCLVAGKPIMYTIGIGKKVGDAQFSAKIAKPMLPSGRAARIVAAGLGADILSADRRWIRPLLRLVTAVDRGRINPRQVSTQLAQINVMVSEQTTTVGPRSIVAFRISPSGGGHHGYTGNQRDDSSPQVPQLFRGFDIGAFAQALMTNIGSDLMFRPGTEDDERMQKQRMQ